jgi:hypothetical protein
VVIKISTWLVIAILLSLSLLINNMKLTSQHVAFALMLLLLALFSDLKEFDFWGLKGKKVEKELRELEGGQALPSKQVKVDQTKLNDAEKNPVPLQLMDTSQGNFLALAFEVERLLRIFATTSLVKDIPNNINIQSLTNELKKKDFLTDLGVKQLEGIRWLRNIIVHGRHSEINQATLDTGVEIALGLYRELYKQLYGEFPEL